jgi:predicted small metal-binding protein
MEKEFRCRDLGHDCDFVACGSTEEELFDKASNHAKMEHNAKSSQEIFDRADEAIHDVQYCEPFEGEFFEDDVGCC